jgi:outer membrane lipoprotein-sorting protein
MNCQQCRDELAAHFEGLLDEDSKSRIESHLAGCPACRAELEEVRRLTVRLVGDGLAPPGASLEAAVMDRILQEQARQLRRLKMRKRLRVLGISGAMAAAAAMFVVSGLWLTQPATAQKAAEALARGAEAVPSPSTVHIVAKMRTSPRDNFSHIDPDLDLVRIEIWRQFGDTPKWRVEKPGRVIVMDGASTVMLIRPTTAVRLPMRTEGAFDSGWMLGLAKVQDMITRQLRAAQARGWELKTTYETTPAGEKKTIVTVEAKAAVPEKDYLRNKFFDDSDTRRVYRFDAKTQRLEGFDAYLHRAGGDVLIWTTERIEYDQPIDPTVFAIDLPKNVNLWKEPERLPDNERYEKMGPQEAARAFFEACGREDWKEVAKFWSNVDERLKEYLGGLKLVSLGEPFQSKGYAAPGKGWFIPYEIMLKNGAVRKHNLAMRKDNPANRYVVDGGL